jgi:hypothetical protein
VAGAATLEQAALVVRTHSGRVAEQDVTPIHQELVAQEPTDKDFQVVITSAMVQVAAEVLAAAAKMALVIQPVRLAQTVVSELILA